LAFPAKATTQTRPRQLFICEAYIASLPRSASLSAPPEKQMVTIWPVNSQQLADKLNSSEPQSVCDTAIDKYDLNTSLQALHDAENAGANVSGRGPYLLAWSPASDKGKPDVLVLRADLSDVINSEQALAILRGWRKDIEQDPTLWKNGWNLDSINLKISLWADKYGPAILKIFGI